MALCGTTIDGGSKSWHFLIHTPQKVYLGMAHRRAERKRKNADGGEEKEEEKKRISKEGKRINGKNGMIWKKKERRGTEDSGTDGRQRKLRVINIEADEGRIMKKTKTKENKSNRIKHRRSRSKERVARALTRTHSGGTRRGG